MKTNNRDDRKPKTSFVSAKRTFFKRVRGCPLSGDDINLNYKNVKLLQRFTSEKGRILPSRITAVCAKKQRELTRAIKQARVLALMPFKA
jgi:small subunit ribosomal protein S18